jgi:predicted dienelactone hydrolase
MPPSKDLMKQFILCAVAIGFGVVLSFDARAATNVPSAQYKPAATTQEISILNADWHDTKRHRDVPVKIYFPTSGGPFPIIIFSHGLGGSRDDYQYLGRYWASHGYISIHIQHLGSDSAVWENSPLTNLMSNMRKAAANLDNASNRPADVTFVIDQLEKLNREDARLKNKLDPSRVGMAGHSFGAFTTLAVAGQVFIGPGGKEISFADSRVKAAIAMSSPVVARKDTLDQSFAKIKIPMLHMTGTEDLSPVTGATRPEDRRLPFDHIRGADQFLLTLNGGNHMTFAGVSSAKTADKENRFKELICESSVAFWDAYLKGNLDAKAWLANDLKRALADNGTFEIKNATEPH